MLVPGLLYGAWTLIHGAYGAWYPYPFVDVTKLGYPKTFRDIGEFIVFFTVAGSVYFAIDRLIGRLHRSV
jgi:hypothetical protein